MTTAFAVARIVRTAVGTRGLGPVLGGTVAFAMLVAAMVPDFGVNLLTEAIGVCFTVLVIDGLLKDRDRQRLAPVLRVATEDGMQIVRGVRGIATKILESTMSLEEAEVASAEGWTLAEPELAAAYNRLDLLGLANVVRSSKTSARRFDYIPFRDWLPLEIADQSRAIDRFLERYISVLEPDVVSAVHALQQATMFKAAPFIPETGHISGAVWSSGIVAVERLAAALQASAEEGRHLSDSSSNMDTVIATVRRVPVQSDEAPFRHPLAAAEVK